MKKLFNKISAPQIIIEFVSVVFAVLLALGLNSYKESITQENNAQKLKAAILSECQMNLRKIDSVLIKNRHYAVFLDSVVSLPNDQVSGFYFTYDYELLTNGAWQIAQNNEAINTLDQDFLMEAADLYQIQSFYTDFSKGVFEEIGVFLARKNELKEANLALSMYYNLSIMNNSAQDLQEDLNQFITKHGHSEE